MILARILWIFDIRLRGNEGEDNARLGEDRKRQKDFRRGRASSAPIKDLWLSFDVDVKRYLSISHYFL